MGRVGLGAAGRTPAMRAVTRLRPAQLGGLIDWIFNVDRVREVTVDGHSIYNPTAVTFLPEGYVETEYEALT